ncbi:hypothetical protein EJ078_20940 [Mesorhizobium sp. M1A.F.Ca.IN.022.06.1.1]|uniref:hypothetical protein n=1 Tax=Mesorhizobium sp. M1A.F.Ca.IN.022.06.1.1 TaxID=2493680 RepID=UPI000F7588C2|nr:hypothetical protein [Mesorhizobium sp. M1A.F.Ca.IN.022.06.1.1]AZO61449.1 hypothetical protein EJ078_20940 [Mesorhizobium sp. M1A.F.Ca.IN.022.06.1.1]
MSLLQHDPRLARNAIRIKRNNGNDRLSGRVRIVLDEHEGLTLPPEGERVGIEMIARIRQHRPAGAELAGIGDTRRIGKAIADTPMRVAEARAPKRFPAEPRQRRAEIGGCEPASLATTMDFSNCPRGSRSAANARVTD